MLVTAAHKAVGLRLQDDGSIASGANDALPAGQYLAAAVLTDRQQRRQEVYRRLFSRPPPPYFEGQTTLLAWTNGNIAPFVVEAGDRGVGESLVAIPIQFRRPEPGSRILVPFGFLPYGVNIQGRYVRPTLEATRPRKCGWDFGCRDRCCH